MPKKTKDFSLKNFRCIPDRGWFGGVCAGLAYWLGLPLWLVRLAWGVAAFFYGLGITIYLLLWIFVPNAEETPADYARRTGDG